MIPNLGTMSNTILKECDTTSTSTRSTIVVNSKLYEVVGHTFTFYGIYGNDERIYDRDEDNEKEPNTPLEKLRHQQKLKNMALKKVKGHKKGRW